MVCKGAKQLQGACCANEQFEAMRCARLRSKCTEQATEKITPGDAKVVDVMRGSDDGKIVVEGVRALRKEASLC